MSKPKMYGMNKATDQKGERRSELLWSRKKQIKTMCAKEYVAAARRRGMEGK